MRKPLFKSTIGALFLLGSLGLLAQTPLSSATAATATKKAAPKPKPKAKPKAKAVPAKSSKSPATTVPAKYSDLALPIGTAGTFTYFDVKWSVRFLSGINPMAGRWMKEPVKSEPGEQWYSLLMEIGNLEGKTETFPIIRFGFSVDANQGDINGGLNFQDNVDGIPNCQESSNLLNLAPGQKVQCHFVVNIKDTELNSYFASISTYVDNKVVVLRIR